MSADFFSTKLNWSSLDAVDEAFLLNTVACGAEILTASIAGAIVWAVDGAVIALAAKAAAIPAKAVRNFFMSDSLMFVYSASKLQKFQYLTIIF